MVKISDAAEAGGCSQRRVALACVSRRYAAFVAALEEGSRDNLEYVKERALRAAAELLRAKPEAEAALLSLLVNKLGDPSRKLASKVRRRLPPPCSCSIASAQRASSLPVTWRHKGCSRPCARRLALP